MADTAKRLVGPKTLAASTATEYTVPASTTAIVRHIRVVNTTATAAVFFMSIGADADGTRMYDEQSVPPNDVLDWSGFLVLAAAETLRMHQTTSGALSITISGVEVT